MSGRVRDSPSLPLVSRLRDSDVYLQAVESGLGIFEMDAAATESEREQFRPVAEWAEGPQSQLIAVDRKIVQLPGRLRLLAGAGSN